TPDGQHLFSVRDGKSYKWDAVTSKQLGSPTTPLVSDGKPTTWGLTTPEGQALWAQRGGPWILWDDKTAPHKLIGPLGVVNYGMVSMLFSPDGKILAVPTLNPKSDTERKITLNEVPTGKLLHSMAVVDGLREGPGPRGRVLGKAVMFFAPDSKLLAAFADAK